MNNTIIIKHYDYDTKTEVVDGEVNTYYLSKCITFEQLACLLADRLNVAGMGTSAGPTMGKVFAQSHCTIQGLLVNVLLTALAEMASDYSDARNEVAVANCNKIKSMLKDGTLKHNPYI